MTKSKNEKSLYNSYIINSNEKNKLYEINREAAVFFYKALRERPNEGYRYMRIRGLTDDTLKQFGIGWADGEWTSLIDHLIDKGYDKDKLTELGLISKEGNIYYDKFRNRVIFPIINIGGKIIGFGGRIVGNGNPKYLNSPESTIFKKKNNLYGLNLTVKEVERENMMILVEGYMDVISLYQTGIRNVSASLGTALTDAQAELIRLYTQNVILSYDADEAGQKAADRGLDILYKKGVNTSVLKVPNGKDPDDFVKSQGRKAFLDLVNSALPYGDFKIDRIKRRYNLDDEQQKIEFMKGTISVIKEMKPVEADIYIKKLVKETQISESAIRKEYNSGKLKQSKNINAIQSKTRVEELPQNEKTLLKLMLRDNRYTALPDDIKDNAFTSTSGKLIHSALLDEDIGERPLDINKIKGHLDQPYWEILDDIKDNAKIGDNEEAAFNGCIATIRISQLEEENRDISNKISEAENKKNNIEADRLYKILLGNQNKIKDLEREIRGVIINDEEKN